MLNLNGLQEEMTVNEENPGIRLDVKTLVLVGTIVVGLAVTWTTLSSRSEEITRRVLLLEQQQVPRIEHDLRDKALQERLSRIEVIVIDIQRFVKTR